MRIASRTRIAGTTVAVVLAAALAACTNPNEGWVTATDTAPWPGQYGDARNTSYSDVSPADVAELSDEEARDELVQVVSRLEPGAATLEESLALWERGEALARRCEEWLVGAKARLDAARAAAEDS